MFNEIVAIDVENRIARFAERIKPFVRSGLHVYASSEEALLSTYTNPAAEAVVISIYQSLTEEYLRQLQALRTIFILGTSTKKIPLDYCRENNITIFNITGYCDHETAEWVLMHTIKHFREINPPRSTFQKTLGIVGAGAVGSLVARYGLALGMNVLYYSQKPHPTLSQQGAQFTELSSLFAACDVISAHTPPESAWLKEEHMLDAKPNLVFINTCMGRIDHNNDLARALMKRPDITVILDSIAHSNYADLPTGTKVIHKPAFKTADSENRLVDMLFANIQKALQQHP